MTHDEYRSLYQKGVEAARAGDKTTARKIFRAASALDAGQKKPWLALAQLESDAVRKAAYYRRVLTIDPQDALARAYLDGMAAGAKTGKSAGKRWLTLGGVMLIFLVGAAAVLLIRPAGETNALPTLNTLPSATLTPAADAMALEVNVSPVESDTRPAAENALITPLAPTQTRFAPDMVLTQPTLAQFSLPSPGAPPSTNSSNTVVTPAGGATIVVQFTPAAPTVLPPTNRPPIVVTAAPSGTAQPTSEPLEVTLGPSPTGFPNLFTETPSYFDDLNTAIAPTDVPFEVDPNAGSGRRPRG